MQEDRPGPSDPTSDNGPLALLDIGFKRFLTLSVIKVLYILGLACIALSWVVVVIGAFTTGVLAGVGAMVLGAFVALLYMIFFRVWLELIVVIFRIGENTTKLVEMQSAQR